MNKKTKQKAGIGLILIGIILLIIIVTNLGIFTFSLDLTDVQEIAITRQTDYIYIIDWIGLPFTGQSGTYTYCFPSGKYNLWFWDAASDTITNKILEGSGDNTNTFTKEGQAYLIDSCSIDNINKNPLWSKPSWCSVTSDDALTICCDTLTPNDYLTCPECTKNEHCATDEICELGSCIKLNCELNKRCFDVNTLAYTAPVNHECTEVNENCKPSEYCGDLTKYPPFSIFSLAGEDYQCIEKGFWQTYGIVISGGIGGVILIVIVISIWWVKRRR